MIRFFNTSADCKPGLHYMVDLSDRLSQIKRMVDAGQYFTINRARQYGKTTILQALDAFLKTDYVVINIDFQLLSASKFRNENAFSIAFAKKFLKTAESNKALDTSVLSQLKTALEENREELELPEFSGRKGCRRRRFPWQKQRLD